MKTFTSILDTSYGYPKWISDGLFMGGIHCARRGMGQITTKKKPTEKVNAVVSKKLILPYRATSCLQLLKANSSFSLHFYIQSLRLCILTFTQCEQAPLGAYGLALKTPQQLQLHRAQLRRLLKLLTRRCCCFLFCVLLGAETSLIHQIIELFLVPSGAQSRREEGEEEKSKPVVTMLYNLNSILIKFKFENIPNAQRNFLIARNLVVGGIHFAFTLSHPLLNRREVTQVNHPGL